MERVTIEINTENEAFEGDGAGLEIARILRRLANRFEEGNPPSTLKDINGNTCGTVGILD